LRHPCKFQRVSRLGSVTARDVPNDGNCGTHAIADQLLAHGVFVDAFSLQKQAVS